MRFKIIESSRKWRGLIGLMFTWERTSFTIVSVNPCWQAYISFVQPPFNRLLSVELFPLVCCCWTTPSRGASFTWNFWFKSISIFHQHFLYQTLISFLCKSLYSFFDMNFYIAINFLYRLLFGCRVNHDWRREERGESFVPRGNFLNPIWINLQSITIYTDYFSCNKLQLSEMHFFFLFLPSTSGMCK